MCACEEVLKLAGDLIDGLFLLVEQNLVQSIVIAYAAIAVLFFTTLLLMSRSRRLKQRLGRIGSSRLSARADKEFDPKNIELALEKLEKKVSMTLQRVGVVRFNAFEDVGSDLSFALAVLDDNGDGFVISSLFGRNETRTYAKPVTGGKSGYQLSAEEREAIRKAMEM